MRRFPIVIAGSLLLTTMMFALPKPKTFSGEIMDDQCGEMGQHGVVAPPFKDARECTIDCVRLGGKYVLFDPVTRVPYGLDDQRRPEAFAGAKVEVTGTLDKMTRTIRVIEIREIE